MRIITKDDIEDVYFKMRQRGLKFILSKFNTNSIDRTKSAFNSSAIHSSNWWIIPKVIARWNMMISGNEQINYKQYLVEDILKGRSGLRLLSIGSGNCSHELELAEYDVFEKIVCLDLAQNRLDEASEKAKNRGLENIEFICKNLYEHDFEFKSYDIVHFNSSLHHFKNMEQLIGVQIKDMLKDDGLLVINEFVGATRLQYSDTQVSAINNSLNLIDKRYRQRYKSESYKKSFRGSGLLRMIVADPSECIESSLIMPSIHKSFTPVVEKAYGGNILMGSLKDISHHFLELDDEKEKILSDLFKYEDDFLENHPSDFIFGVYRKKKM